MTDTQTPLPEHRRKSDKFSVGNLLLGLPFLVGGGWLLAIEVKAKEVHSLHVFLFAGLAVLGGAIIDFQPVARALGTVSKRAGALLPSRKE